MKSGLLTIGLTTLDVVARPIDGLPIGEGTTLIEGIACAPAGTAAGAAMAPNTIVPDRIAEVRARWLAVRSSFIGTSSRLRERWGLFPIIKSSLSET